MHIMYDDLEEKYIEFIKYAFKTSECFSIIMPRVKDENYEKGDIGYNLKEYLIKQYYASDGIPIVENVFRNKQVLNVYSCCKESRDIVINYGNLLKNGCDLGAEDICFYRNDVAWFYSITHEQLASIYYNQKADVDFLKAHNIQLSEEGYQEYYYLKSIKRY